MASALARGWDEPAVVADIDRERAAALAEAVGGTVAGLATPRSPSRRTSSCSATSRRSSRRWPRRYATHAGAVVSILGGVPGRERRGRLPRQAGLPLHAEPGRRGAAAACRATSAGSTAADGPEEEILDLFGRVGTVVAAAGGADGDGDGGDELRARVVRARRRGARRRRRRARARARAGRAPGRRRRSPAPARCSPTRASTPAELRRRVTSPGGLTERGTARLEDAGIRAAFDSAVDAVVNPS